MMMMMMMMMALELPVAGQPCVTRSINCIAAALRSVVVIVLQSHDAVRHASGVKHEPQSAALWCADLLMGELYPQRGKPIFVQ
jgi:hypothetical protein